MHGIAQVATGPPQIILATLEAGAIHILPAAPRRVAA